MNDARPDYRRLLPAAGAAVLAALLLFAARDALVPFVIGTLAAYICAPAVARLSCHMPRPVAALLLTAAALLLALAVPLLLVPVLVFQVFELLALLPDAVDALRSRLAVLLPEAADFQPAGFKGILSDLAEYAGSAGSAVAGVFSWLGTGIKAVVVALATLLIMPLVMFYLLADWQRVLERGRLLLPEAVRAPVLEVLAICDRVLSEFLRAQLLVIVIMMVVYSLLLAIAGVSYPVALGAISGLLSFIPYAGFLVGLVLAVTVAALDFSGYAILLWAAGAMTAGALLESFLITPWLIGERIGLGPVAVMLALAVMGSAFGFVGVLIAIPAAAIVVALGRHYRERSSGSG